MSVSRIPAALFAENIRGNYPHYASFQDDEQLITAVAQANPQFKLDYEGHTLVGVTCENSAPVPIPTAETIANATETSRCQRPIGPSLSATSSRATTLAITPSWGASTLGNYTPGTPTARIVTTPCDPRHEDSVAPTATVAPNGWAKMLISIAAILAMGLVVFGVHELNSYSDATDKVMADIEHPHSLTGSTGNAKADALQVATSDEARVDAVMKSPALRIYFATDFQNRLSNSQFSGMTVEALEEPAPTLRVRAKAGSTLDTPESAKFGVESLFYSQPDTVRDLASYGFRRYEIVGGGTTYGRDIPNDNNRSNANTVKEEALIKTPAFRQIFVAMFQDNYNKQPGLSVTVTALEGPMPTLRISAASGSLLDTPQSPELVIKTLFQTQPETIRTFARAGFRKLEFVGGGTTYGLDIPQE